MKKSFLLIFIFVLVSKLSFSQTFTISGYINDKNTGEVLIGATIVEKSILKGAVSNGYGYFSLSLPKGEHRISCSYVGFKSYTFTIDLQKDTIANIWLEEQIASIDEVIITAEEKEDPILTNEYNVEKLTVKNIRQLPSLFGEADLIKAIQLQTGIKTLGDGSSGMFIRGGSSDQNLIIIDEAPIYNPSHMFGLISVFNPDALNNVTLYKSNMPAQYGGRTSAVIDCKMKEGSLYNYNFSAGLNPFSASIYADGPIMKEKSAFLVSARKSLVDLFFLPDAQGYFEIIPGFYDLNIKLNTKVGDRNRIFFSFYNGKDRLQSADGFSNNWSNRTGTLRWNRNFSSKWFSNCSLIYSNYSNSLEFTEEDRNYQWLTGVTDVSVKADLSYYISPDNTIKIGVNSIYHRFIPGETADTLESIPGIQSIENAMYVSNDIKLTSWLGFNYGLRVSFFQNSGKATWYEYSDSYEFISSKSNESGIYNTEKKLEPRLSINLRIHPGSSMKLAYARNAQYMQVLQNSSLSYTSMETWFPSNPNIKPIVTDVFSIGWFWKIQHGFLFSSEVYYKASENRIDYIDHAKLINNPYIEAEVRIGKEQAYGADFEFKKTKGDFTGSVGYSYSRAIRKIEGINSGKEYPAPYDIPHDIRILGSYKINNYWSFSSIWMYNSGRPATLPIGFYYQGNNAVPIYSQRNSSRFPDYHRLDIAATYTTKAKKKKLFWDISFGIYNVYARQNPIGYDFFRWGDTLTVRQYSLFTILPNFSVKANF